MKLRAKLIRGVTVEEVLKKLPPLCAARHPASGEVVVIQRGEQGYCKAPPGFFVDTFNRAMQVTPAQREAMLAGSMFGWEAPAANPDNYIEEPQRGRQ